MIKYRVYLSDITLKEIEVGITSINKVSVKRKKRKIVKIKLCNKVTFTDENHMHKAIWLRTLLFKMESWNTNSSSNSILVGTQLNRVL